MVVGFTVQGLDGKPSDAGTVEEWWAAPGQRRTVVTSRLLQETVPAEADGPQSLSEDARRERYLVHLLLQQIVSPLMSDPDQGKANVSVNKISRQKVALECLDVTGPDVDGSVHEKQVTYCMEPGDGRLRVITDSGNGTEVVINRPATFQQVQLGMETTVALGAPAISGYIKKLSGWTPDQEPETLTKDAASPALSSVVIAGRKIGGSVPTYPESAQREHGTGRVILGALISADGTVKDLTVLASPRADLANAAKNAVATWTYKPYALDGKPTEVKTMVTVNFNMR